MYYLIKFVLYLISLLPFWILRRFSDFTAFLLFYIFKYRKKVVFKNLENAFPSKSEYEIKQIAKANYFHLSDLLFETIKLLSISKKSLKKHFVFENIEVLNKYLNDNRSIIAVMGHHGNWEMAGARFALEANSKLKAIYHPIKNQNFNKLMYNLRTRFGSKLYSFNDTVKEMIKNKNETTVTAFIADQTPTLRSGYWLRFLNQDTLVFKGTEKIAKKLNFPVIYVSIKKVKRNYYKANFIALTDEPQESENLEISKLHTKALEKDIIKQPENWLWSHRRWKHKKTNSPSNP